MNVHKKQSKNTKKLKWSNTTRRTSKANNAVKTVEENKVKGKTTAKEEFKVETKHRQIEH